uniref:J domain-containing protein n=1 Tax=Arcella intermedia TaxID=1963864 RepID=A0A6B2LVA0_9EUKA
MGFEASPDVDMVAVKKAWKTLSLKWHPDKNPNCEDCNKKYLEISEAWEQISKHHVEFWERIAKENAEGTARVRARGGPNKPPTPRSRNDHPQKPK